MIGSAIAAGTMVTITTANGQTRAGKLVSHNSGSRLTKRGKVTSHYASIELATDTRTVEINYLDIAHTGRAGPP